MRHRPDPIHTEWLIALLGDVHARDDALRHGSWYELEPFPEHRTSMHGLKCIQCNRKLTPGEVQTQTYWNHKKTWGSTFSLAYVALPEALRRTPRQPIAYWIGRCRGCGVVYWAADHQPTDSLPLSEVAHVAN